MPLRRPHDHKRATAYPVPPPSLVGMDAVPGFAPPGALARVAERLGCTLAEVDARCSVDDVLDDLDMQAYLYDVDHEPQGPPKVQR